MLDILDSYWLLNLLLDWKPPQTTVFIVPIVYNTTMSIMTVSSHYSYTIFSLCDCPANDDINISSSTIFNPWSSCLSHINSNALMYENSHRSITKIH